MTTVSLLVPAWNEADFIAATLRALRSAQREEDGMGLVWDELIVIDDGSTDATAEKAALWADRVVRHPVRSGKGAALTSGIQHAAGDIVVFLDADLGLSSAAVSRLIEPVRGRQADMAVAVLPPPAIKGGVGLVKGLAGAGIRRLAGYRAAAPLSGQRALRREVLRAIGKLPRGFGVEVALTIDVVRAGFRIAEVAVPFRHRETARDWRGAVHRGRQFWAVSAALWQKWREHPCR